MDLVLLLNHLVLNKYQQVSKKKRSIHSVVVGDVCDVCMCLMFILKMCCAFAYTSVNFIRLRSFVHIFFAIEVDLVCDEWKLDMGFLIN